MVGIEAWMNELTQRLKQSFGTRLLFLGLQGSYGRGEATEQSDIDVVTILDTVQRSDLEVYRAEVRQMPSGDQACGFLCGKQELRGWPKYDLLQLVADTRPWYGALESLMPRFTRQDLIDAVRNGAANLYHAACHTYLYAERTSWPVFLQAAQKSAFFVLRCWYQLQSGRSVRTRRALISVLEGDARQILEADFFQEAGAEKCFEQLLHWSGSVLKELEPIETEIP